METRGGVPGSTVAPEEVAALLARPGPFATVYLCTEAGIDNASQRSVGRWKPLRAELLEQGASEAVVEAVDAAVPEAHLHGDGLAVVVPAGGGAHVEHLPEPPDHDEVRWGELPTLAPLLASRQRRVPHVLVSVDRKGADLTAVRIEGPDVEVETVEVKGDEHPIHRAKPGGWSQRRYQQRVLATWEENADEVAAEVARLVKRVDARLVIVAGDTRAVKLLGDSMPPDIAELVREVEGSRADDGSDALSEHDVRRLLATEVAGGTAQLLQKMKEERGQDDRAADGLAATAAAVSEARAAAVLVPEDAGGATLWYGAEPVPVATSRQALTDLGGDDPREGPANEVLIRAALGTGAGIRIVPANALPERVGAILRW
jgi:Bacterial archaeo-eukaryotic release factor family 2